MPVFTRKVKITTDDSQRVENIPSNQNYDFSKMKMSQASNKPSGPRPEGEEREPREDGERQERPPRKEYTGNQDRGNFDRANDRPAAKQQTFDDDEGFEEVKEKRKPQQFFRSSKPQV